MAQLASVSERFFTASVDHAGPEVVFRLTGTADALIGQNLENLLSVVHDSALMLNVPQVRVDLRELVFMNSSCLKDIVTWLNKVRLHAGPGGYRIILVSSVKQRWHRRTVEALRCFAPEAVTLETA
jgi:hypothetical protein